MKESKVKCILGCIRAHWYNHNNCIGDYVAEMFYAKSLEMKLEATLHSHRKHNRK